MANNGTGTNSQSKVTAGKPRVGGAVYRAIKGTTLPTDAVTALTADYKCLGYCSEDGVSNGNGRSSDNVAAWGGDIVLNLLKAGNDTFVFTLIEALNEEVLKSVYGSSNVTTDESGDIAVAVNGGSDEEAVYIFELILKGGAVKRIVVPCASITALGEVKYSDNSAIGYAVTLTAVNDENSNSHYEYIHTSSTTEEA